MRLLNTKTLRLELFASNEAVRYAILSHTWGEDEATFEHLLLSEDVERLKGWEKICRSCAVAAALQLEYIWIDTCCIDKTSSAELAEAINSMFQWYEKAQLCIAFLDDVCLVDDPSKPGSQFRQSRWFTRGWTLQELIAPSELLFYSQDWEPLGTRISLKSVVGDITGVPEGLLETKPDGGRSGRLEDISLAEKMAWAANRTTTRPEDVAYCLLGIFDINMPLLYGEGRVKAFKRLQEEIIRSTSDDSIYAWRYPPELAERQHYWGLLAESPAAFGKHEGLTPKLSKYLTRRSSHAPAMSSRGLHLELALTPFPNDKSGSIFLAFLDCDMRRDCLSTSLTPAILLQRTSWHDETNFVRIRPDIVALLMMNRVVLPDHLAETARGASETQDAALAEAEPRRIFIPHGLTAARSPHGIIFHPVIGPPDEKLFVVTVLSRSPTWHQFVGQPRPVSDESYVMNFDLSPVPGVAEMKQPTMLGAVELEVKQPDGWNSWLVCLVTGLEPLPANVFGTPALYVVPWYAFETKERVAAGCFANAMNKDSRTEHHALLKHSLRASFDLESQFSRLYYRVVLRIQRSDEKTRWR